MSVSCAIFERIAYSENIKNYTYVSLSVY